MSTPATMPQAIAHSSKLMRKCTRRQATKSFDRGRARGRPWLSQHFQPRQNNCPRSPANTDQIVGAEQRKTSAQQLDWQ